VDRLASSIHLREAVVFSGIAPHVPKESVDAAFEVGRDGRVDGVITVGGGSAIGTGKAVTARLIDEGVREHLPLVVIPTTYAGSEMTSVYGVTEGGRKTTTRDIRVLPAAVLYDPDLTLDLPASVTSATASNALAHCVEGIYSKSTTPVARATALYAIPKIFSALPKVLQNGHDLGARSTLLVAAQLGGVTIAHAGMALHHAICHALGAEGVPHGEANAIMLPHVMHFNLPAAGNDLADIALALSGSSADAGARGVDPAEHTIAAVESLISSLPIPHSLRETVVTPDDFPRIAEATLLSSLVRLNPRPVTDSSEVVAILRSAW
jgi:alcohol dehydrogenase class IV